MAMESELSPAFDVVEPAEVSAPLLFNSPHSGRVYPDSFLAASRLDPLALRRSEDAFVDLLLEGLARNGTTVMSARFPRAWLDVNREPYELDPRMFEGRLPNFANTRSLRVAGGLGTIARLVGESQEIYARRLPVEEAMRRIETFYKPYHRTLRRLLTQMHHGFGVAVLVDCHSMPSTACSHVTPHPMGRVDVVLGDRHGVACADEIVSTLEELMRGQGLRILRNKPYSGGFITQNYGSPAHHRHALQIEINRALYLDERTLERSRGFAATKLTLNRVFAGLLASLPDIMQPRRQAAE